MEGANSSVSEEATASSKRALAHEGDVGLHGETGSGERSVHGDDVGAVEAERIGEDEPALDAAFLAVAPVVIEHAVHPFAPQVAIVRPAHQGGVLARHGRLVAVAVERPGLHLAFVELAAVEEAMEGMLVVVALGANLTDGRFQRGRAHGAAHSRISMPS